MNYKCFLLTFYFKESNDEFSTWIQFVTALAAFLAIIISTYSLYKTYLEGPHIKIIPIKGIIEFSKFKEVGYRNHYYIINSGSRDGFVDKIEFKAIRKKWGWKNYISEFNISTDSDIQYPLFVKQGESSKVDYVFLLKDNESEIFIDHKTVITLKLSYVCRIGIKSRRVKIINKISKSA